MRRVRKEANSSALAWAARCLTHRASALDKLDVANPESGRDFSASTGVFVTHGKCRAV